MTATVVEPRLDAGHPLRRLGLVGAWGAPLTVVIIVTSALLRLATQIQAGEAVSTLPADLEHAARMTHRIAASGVGLLAAFAFVTAYRAHPIAREFRFAVGAVVGFTLLLAVVGRYSTGYGSVAIVALNVMGGTILACAFWFLRERAAAPAGRFAAWPLVALCGIVALTPVGAATSFARMHGDMAFGPAHLWLATLLAIVAVVAALRHRACGLPAGVAAALVIAQYGMGFVLLASGRPLYLTLLHAAMSGLLALSLVSLVVRGGVRP